MESKIVLSICIPTYNRGEYLKLSLSILLSQIKAYKSAIEILISDNCSSDNTSSVVHEFIEKSDFLIKYNRNDRNIGADKNFKWCIDNANGEYVYVMGDDDIISPNFIDIILPIISCEKYTIIHWNRLTGDADCNNNKLTDGCFTGSPIEVLEVKDLIWRVMDFPNFISSVIFLRSVFEIDTQSYNPQYEGYYIFAQMYWGALQIGGQCLYYYFPLVIQRNPQKTWIQYWPLYNLSSMSNIFHDLDVKVPGIYAKWMKKMHANSSNVLTYVVQYRNYYRQKEIREKMIRHLSRREKVKYYFYLYVPGCFLLYRAKRKILKCVNKLLG